LRQQELAELFGVSLIPIREALRKLEMEGSITFLPYRGASVSPLSVEEFQQVTEMRIPLTALALRKAVPKMTLELLDRAEGVLDEIEHETNPLRFGQEIWRFYETLLQASDRPLLLEVIKGLFDRIQRYLHLYLPLHRQKDLDMPNLRDLLKACRTGDARLAVRLMEKRHKAAAKGICRAIVANHSK
jgi:DNA-binding GntR family transcriptional regulator